ncbi:MAG TPA: efflux RND transporter permease subunit, partial [Polyangiaceae bacterium]
FRALAFTVTTAVLVSLAVALVLVPLAATFRRARPPRTHKESRIMREYNRLVDATLAHRWTAPVGLALAIVTIAIVAPRLERGFLPTMDEGAFVVDYFLPAGTSLESTEQYARLLEREIKATPEVTSYSRRTGAELGPAAATQAYRGDIMVRLVPHGARKRSADDVIADLRTRVAHVVPEARVEFVQVLQDVLNDLAGNPRPVEVEVLGTDYVKLHEVASAIGAKMRHTPGVVDLYDGQERNAPDVRLSVDRDATARLGLSPDDVASELDDALRGRVVGSVRRFDRLVGVRARYPNPVRYDRERIIDMPLSTRERVTTLGAVTHVTTSESEPALVHEALQPVVLVTADHEGRDLGSVSNDVDAILRSTSVPPGYRLVLGGQAGAERASLKELLVMTALAALLVLTVLAAQFRRLRVAALVLGAVPVAVLGGALALFVTRVPLNASSLMGGVLLVGLVVKNGVLLLEHAERAVDNGTDPREAVRLACDRRVRPIAMTTLATLAGLAPLALGIGAGAELQRPLAIVVMGGLVTSTAATLVLIPPVASVLLRARSAIRRGE